MNPNPLPSRRHSVCRQSVDTSSAATPILGRAKAVETSGIIRPFRIAEIGRAVGADESVERVGGQWSPEGIG